MKKIFLIFVLLISILTTVGAQADTKYITTRQTPLMVNLDDILELGRLVQIGTITQDTAPIWIAFLMSQKKLYKLPEGTAVYERTTDTFIKTVAWIKVDVQTEEGPRTGYVIRDHLVEQK